MLIFSHYILIKLCNFKSIFRSLWPGSSPKLMKQLLQMLCHSNAPTRFRHLLNDSSLWPWSMKFQILYFLIFNFFQTPPQPFLLYHSKSKFLGPVQTNLCWKKGSILKFFCTSSLDNSFQSGSDVEKGFHGLSGFPAIWIMVNMDVNLNLPCKLESETKQAGTVRAG